VTQKAVIALALCAMSGNAQGAEPSELRYRIEA
jgi:hypothetical protein